MFFQLGTPAFWTFHLFHHRIHLLPRGNSRNSLQSEYSFHTQTRLSHECFSSSPKFTPLLFNKKKLFYYYFILHFHILAIKLTFNNSKKISPALFLKTTSAFNREWGRVSQLLKVTQEAHSSAQTYTHTHTLYSVQKRHVYSLDRVQSSKFASCFIPYVQSVIISLTF